MLLLNIMNDYDRNRNKHKYAVYGIMLGILGLIELFSSFPNGMFPAFFFGVMGVVLSLISGDGVMGRPDGPSIAGIVLSSVAMGLSLVLYFSMIFFFSTLKDPVAGPQFFRYYEELFASQGIPAASISELFRIR